MTGEALSQWVYQLLDEHKGTNILILDVQKLTSITDFMIICTATSARHGKALAQHLVVNIKASGRKVFGVAGDDDGEWILIDLGDVVVHIMLSSAREFYALEKLWSLSSTEQTA